MRLVTYLALPVGIIAVGAIYWFLSYDPAGTAMLVIFGIAMGVMSWALVPTFGDVGPTAPVDPLWHESAAAAAPATADPPPR